jgi:hypothetical protein
VPARLGALVPTAGALSCAALGCALTLAYLPATVDAGRAGRWAVLAVGLAALLHFRAEPCKSRAGHALGALFLGWCALTLLWTPNLSDGAAALAQLLILAMAFVLGARLPSLLPVYMGMGAGLSVNGAVAVAQEFYGFDGVWQVFPPAGLFVSKNWLAEAAALVLVALLAHRRWLLAAAVLPCLAFSNARGALLGLGVVAVLALWRRAPLLARFGSLCAGLVLAAALAGFLADWRLFSLNSLGERGIIWQNALGGLTWLGRGLGSFYHDYPLHGTLQDLLVSRPTHAHSDFLEWVYELGPGALLPVALLAFCLRTPAPVERAVLTVFIVEACFGFPAHLPVTGFVAALAAGHLAAAGEPLRGLLARGRMVLRAGLARGRPACGAAAVCAGAGGVSAGAPVPAGAGGISLAGALEEFVAARNRRAE